MKYLVVFECPCVGTDAMVIEAENDVEAETWSWETSCKVREYVDGGYDLYRLCYDNKKHTHVLDEVLPIDISVDCKEGAF